MELSRSSILYLLLSSQPQRILIISPNIFKQVESLPVRLTITGYDCSGNNAMRQESGSKKTAALAGNLPLKSEDTNRTKSA